jgi:hypothetical protein
LSGPPVEVVSGAAVSSTRPMLVAWCAGLCPFAAAVIFGLTGCGGGRHAAAVYEPARVPDARRRGLAIVEEGRSVERGQQRD